LFFVSKVVERGNVPDIDSTVLTSINEQMDTEIIGGSGRAFRKANATKVNACKFAGTRS